MKHLPVYFLIPFLLVFISCQDISGTKSAASEKIIQSEQLFADALNIESNKKNEYFHRAAVLLESAIAEEKIDNGYIYYNSANAWFQAGYIGKAILNYRKAAIRLPSNNFIQNNLAIARSEVNTRIEIKEKNPLIKALLFFHYDISFKSRVILFVFLVMILCIFLSFLLFRKNRYIVNLSIVTAILIFVLLTSIGVSVSAGKEGVVVIPEIEARKGDNNGYETSFSQPLTEGVEFSILSSRPGWFQIELKDGNQCWIPDYAVEIIE